MADFYFVIPPPPPTSTHCSNHPFQLLQHGHMVITSQSVFSVCSIPLILRKDGATVFLAWRASWEARGFIIVAVDTISQVCISGEPQEYHLTCWYFIKCVVMILLRHLALQGDTNTKVTKCLKI